MFIPLAGILGVPAKQAGEINFRCKWENQDEDKGPCPELYHQYEDEIELGPRVLAGDSGTISFQTLRPEPSTSTLLLAERSLDF